MNMRKELTYVRITAVECVAILLSALVKLSS